MAVFRRRQGQRVRSERRKARLIWLFRERPARGSRQTGHFATASSRCCLSDILLTCTLKTSILIVDKAD